MKEVANLLNIEYHLITNEIHKRKKKANKASTLTIANDNDNNSEINKNNNKNNDSKSNNNININNNYSDHNKNINNHNNKNNNDDNSNKKNYQVIVVDDASEIVSVSEHIVNTPFCFGGFKYTLINQDLNCLSPGRWLNDSIMNFFVGYLIIFNEYM